MIVGENSSESVFRTLARVPPSYSLLSKGPMKIWRCRFDRFFCCRLVEIMTLIWNYSASLFHQRLVNNLQFSVYKRRTPKQPAWCRFTRRRGKHPAFCPRSKKNKKIWHASEREEERRNMEQRKRDDEIKTHGTLWAASFDAARILRPNVRIYKSIHPFYSSSSFFAVDKLEKNNMLQLRCRSVEG